MKYTLFLHMIDVMHTSSFPSFQYLSLTFLRNKPGTAQVGAISKAQKDSKTTFLQLETTKALKKLKIEKKNPNFFLFFFEVSGKSQSAEKCKKGDAFYLMLDALDALKLKY